MRQLAIALPALLVLAACATPREACVAAATREGRVVDALVAQTQGNLNRGFAIEERQEVRVRHETCEGEAEDGTTFEVSCQKTDTVTVRDAVAIDLTAERAKLESLLERQRQNQINAQSAIQQCIAVHPE